VAFIATPLDNSPTANRVESPKPLYDFRQRAYHQWYSPDQPGSLVRAAPILTTAATLHTHGVTRIDTARQAAEALRPLAGKAAYWLFTLGLIGTGMLGVPVLAGSSVYAIPEASVWRGSLEKKPRGARRFYVVLTGPWSAGSRLISWGWTPSR
jgi:hypothetical protein